ncbi:hypothetical protein AB0D59_05675 [Streptomyces sp. NPDC048417]|uniref:hypothetical protein n=1 Tax=Streptomyces sp. NPDC048417 TaxID=3155387 RepID=UPI00342F8FE6
MTNRQVILGGPVSEEQIGYARVVVRPAATMMLCGPADPRMKIGIKGCAGRATGDGA